MAPAVPSDGRSARRGRLMPYAIDPATGKQRRGFARMSPETRRQVASKGGAAQAPSDRAFSRDRELAVAAGRKGGLARGATPITGGEA